MLVNRSSEIKIPFIYDFSGQEIHFLDWIKNNRDAIDEKIMLHGSVLFKGLYVHDSESESIEMFEASATALSVKGLFNENGEHPHINLQGYVSKPVDYSASQQLLWHSENSFNHSWPQKIWFQCLLPSIEGGETTLVDNRRVFTEIPKNIRDEFISRDVLYVRNYTDGAGLNWQTVFATESKSEVESYCQNNKMLYEWTPDGSLRTLCKRPAVIEHPATKEPCWFNQAQHWHMSCLDGATREAIQSLYQEEEYPRTCYFGDKTPIPDEMMYEILETYRTLERGLPWEKGNIMMLDNVLTAHGRNRYRGERKLLVALGDMQTFDTCVAVTPGL